VCQPTINEYDDDDDKILEIITASSVVYRREMRCPAWTDRQTDWQL